MRTKPALLLQLFSRGQKPKLEIIQPEVNPEPNSYSPKIIRIYTKRCVTTLNSVAISRLTRMEQEGERQTANRIQVTQDTTRHERRMAVLTTESSFSAITEGVSAADSSKGGVLTKIFIMGAILLVTVVGAKKWFFPYTMDDLERQIACVGNIIEQNMTLEEDLLGDMGWIFRDRLDGYVDEHEDFCRKFVDFSVQGTSKNGRNSGMGDHGAEEMEIVRLGWLSLAGDEGGSEVP
ncbi:hypothetical protein AAF712_012185 [Marasmius tenuissimus]|uniref:Uncharacterized protein n=1 Tax=Marasmius tenuissimus TaxID=585030 RepID=A0ABR2ZIE8_9AGAR